MNPRLRNAASSLTLALSVLFPGCLLIRTTEMHISIEENGGANVKMVLSDIRSDAPTDSERVRDYGIMMASLSAEGLHDLEEREELTFLDKKFFLRGDTLDAEVLYAVHRVETIEGLRTTADEFSVLVSRDREILSTNGRIERMSKTEQRIVWPPTARELSYVIRERSVSSSVSLASDYRKYGEMKDEGNDEVH
jgi:hypothetical protein